ncbi:hypothetical protein LTR78_005429 [Recurvomyces mirabilis]|uniref:Peptidase A1 domain-containing protein n=1 Tax=Recurvomyces mirabilis TaxID=574656 RepID=A0AAE0WMZ9_9PEZI|nr:hypothetical protein LTR78_005429 [Recurvomyces mirabilis]KAK5152665.1 hypothetical protein LTS14_008199 [Recurvomyces mirabilis]
MKGLPYFPVSALLTIVTAADSSILSISLNQATKGASISQQAHHAAARRHGGYALAPETLDGGFWYGSFDVGEAMNVSLLIDTGSSDVSINPDLYQPSLASLDLHQNGTLGYSTVQENGCGFANISYHTYADTVSFAGLTARNQTFAAVIAKPPPDNGTITQFPHQGIVGFSSTHANTTQLDAIPLFQTLCNQHTVRECKFGLALGTDGNGTQVLGGTDHQLFDGDLITVDADPNEEYAFDGSITADGSVALTSDRIIPDSGTANVIGPISDVQKLFDILGIQAVQQNLPGCTSVLFGYYPCDAPPKVGFTIGNSTKSFDIESSAFQQADNGNNNCTAIVTGIDLSTRHPLWIIGQAWFQGKYVDFDPANSKLGVAPLKADC